TPTTQIYTLSLHDALPIYTDLGLERTTTILSGVGPRMMSRSSMAIGILDFRRPPTTMDGSMTSTTIFRPNGRPPGGTLLLPVSRSEEHTSELQSRENLVCR